MQMRIFKVDEQLKGVIEVKDLQTMKSIFRTFHERLKTLPAVESRNPRREEEKKRSSLDLFFWLASRLAKDNESVKLYFLIFKFLKFSSFGDIYRF